MTLYRLFSMQTHADEFLSGAIRFGHLNAYRTSTQVGRKDVREGTGRYRENRADRMAAVIKGDQALLQRDPGVMTVHSDVGNHVFICSLTQPADADAWARVRKEFGDVVVAIEDPNRLLADIRKALDQHDPWQRRIVPQLWPAVYDKDQLVKTGKPADRFDAIKRAATQKAPDYAYQHEHRVVLLSHGLPKRDGDPPAYLYVRMPQRPGYLRILDTKSGL